MKKIISALLMITLVFSFQINVTANDNIECYCYDDVTFIFDESCTALAYDTEQIAQKLLNHEFDSDLDSFSILCLFGHKYEVGYVTTVTHRVNSTQPRCLREYYEIGECTRCGHTYATLLATEYITCCPND